MSSPYDARAILHHRVSGRLATIATVAIMALVLTGFVAPAVGVASGPSPDTPTPNATATTSIVSSTAPLANHSVSAQNVTNLAASENSYAVCSGKGPIRGAICNVIENTKRSILGGALDATQKLARSTLELILHRPAPKRGEDIVVFRPPTNQPLAGTYTGWTAVGLPLGFLVWIVGAGVALASRFRPEAAFATQGFQIEQQLGRNLLLTLGSWWVGAFVLHLANGLVLAVAPRGDQLVMGPQSGIGTLLGTGLLAGLLWVATAAIVTILLVTTLLAYFLCLTFMVFLPVFSALMLFDTGGVFQTIGQFGRTGWDIFIRAAFFPLPAALVLGAGAYVAAGTMGFVESAVGVAGFDAVAGTLAFAAVTFVTQLAALVATLWMVLGSRAARTAGGVMAGVGGAAMYTRAKAGAQRVAGTAAMPSVGSLTGTASSATATGTTTSSDTGTWAGRGSPGTNGDVLNAGRTTATSGALSASGQDGNGTDGSVVSLGTPTGGRLGVDTSSTTSDGASSGIGTADLDGFDPVVVTGQRDLPSDQRYQPGYVFKGEFQPVETRGQNRSLIVRNHDRFAAAYDTDGDHPGVLYRGEEDGTLYDASPVAGEDWDASPAEETKVGRDAVFDARRKGGGTR